MTMKAVTMRTLPRRCLAAVAVIALGPAGCTASGTTSKGKPDVQVMTEADVTRQVRNLAEQVRAATGAPKLLNDRASSAPCDSATGDDTELVRYVQGSYNMSLPAREHAAAFRKVRDQWQGAGWTIDDYRVADNGDGTMSAKAPGQGFSFTMVTAKAPDTLGLIVHSGCYRDESRG